MSNQKKRHPRLRKLKWAVLALSFLIAATLVLLYSFIKSPAFVDMVERKVGANTPFVLEIGSLELAGLSSISLTELSLSRKDSEALLVKLKSAEIGFSLFGLLKSEVESVSVEGLEVSLDLTGKKGEEDKPALNSIHRPASAGAMPPAIPFIVKHLVVVGATIKIKHLKEDGSKGLVEIGPVLISLASDREPLISYDKGERRAVHFKLNTKSISKHFGVDDPHEIELSVAYFEEDGEVYIGPARVSSGLIGSVEFTGNVTGIGTDDIGDIGVNIALNAGPLKLAGVDAMFLPAGLNLAGEGSGTASLKGQVNKGLQWSTDFSVAGLMAKAGGFDIDATKGPIKLASKGTIDLSSPDGLIVEGGSSLSLNAAAFSSKEGDVMGEGFDLEVEREFSFVLDSKSGGIKGDFKASALLKGFEFVAGNIYTDFTKKEIALKISGGFHNDGLTINDGLVKISDIATLSFGGRVDGLSKKSPAPAFDLSFALKWLSNARAYEAFLKESLPVLANMDISGSSSLDARIKGTPSGFSMLGELKVMETSLVGSSKEVVKQPEEEPSEKAGETKAPQEEEEPAEMDGLFSIEELKALEAAVEGREPSAQVEVSDEEGEAKSPTPLFSLIDIEARLPFYLTYPGAYKGRRENKRQGTITIGEIRLREAVVEDFKASPLLWDNRLSFAGDFEIPLFSGNVALKNVLYENIVGSERELSLGVDIDGIKLGEVAGMLGLPPFKGTLTGSIPIVTLSGRTLRTDGLVELDLFNGRIGIRDIKMDNLLSPTASFKSSIEIDSLDLAELTRTFEFGLISGVLTGYVQDLVIMNGLPVSFAIQMETVKTRGVPQRIDVKALKKIQVFSSGSSVSILDKGIYRFFKEYGYSKMGFSGRLKNDRFSLLGVEMADNKRYIVMGALVPPRVDVVSHTRDISFAELVKRLKRVQKTK